MIPLYIPGLFAKDEWGGANQAYLLDSGLVGVIGHKCYSGPLADGVASQIYMNMSFVIDPGKRELLDLKIIGTRPSNSMKLKRRWRILMQTVLLSAACGGVSAENAYLRPDDQLLTCGDSITSPGTYQAYMSEVLKALYPDNSIAMINLGSGGQGAPFGVASIKGYKGPTASHICLFMFGVNDTGWNQSNADAKIATFVDSLQQAVDLAKERQLSLIFLRETHFSHGANPPQDAFERMVTGMLDKLQAAQTALAAENQIPIIDVRGGYQRALERAWAKDPACEFTPDIIHPTPPGQAAMAGEILRALGAGLPLGTGGGQRGEMHLTPSADLSMSLADATDITSPDGTVALTVTVKNTTNRVEEGTLTVVVAGTRFAKEIKLPAMGDETIEFTLPMTALTNRFDVTPVYMAFVGQRRFAADSSLFFYSRIQPAKKTPVTLSSASFVTLKPEQNPRICPVTDIRVVRDGEGFTIDFTWNDTTPVMAKKGVGNYCGVPIPTPINMNARDSQPSDAVEFFFDLRSADAIGRWTSNIDANPAGILRVGVYQELLDGKPVAKVMTEPALSADVANLSILSENRYRLTVKAKPEGPCTGFSMRVTDNTELKTDSTLVFLLPGYPQYAGKDPMTFIQLGTNDDGILYRTGY